MTTDEFRLNGQHACLIIEHDFERDEIKAIVRDHAVHAVSGIPREVTKVTLSLADAWSLTLHQGLAFRSVTDRPDDRLGERIALTRALRRLSRDERRQVWHRYHGLTAIGALDLCKETIR